MMVALNLIPEAIRERLRVKRLFGLLRSLLLVLTVYTIMLAVLVMLSRLILQRQFARIIEETTLVTVEHRGLEEQIRTLNGEISRAVKIQNEAQPWPELLALLTESIPRGITVDAMTLDAAGLSAIKGVAATRDDLLALKEALVAMPAFADVDLPITDLLKRIDAPFTITFTIQLHEVAKR